MRISDEQARRWGLIELGDPTDDMSEPVPLHLPVKLREAAEAAEADQLDTDPTALHLTTMFKAWERIEADAAATKREIAARLMEYRPISITQLATMLGVSRPTLYAWQREAEERAQDDRGQD